MNIRARILRDERVLWWMLGLLQFALGVFLRCYQIGIQIPLDDEWHAINKLLHADAWNIATHFGIADYSIPLTLYDRFVYLHGGLSEWGLRAPMLVCGIGLLLVAPWLLRRDATPATLAVWVGLMAISPVMVYLTRIARPYAITNLLCFVAIIAFRRWWQDRRRLWAAVYVGCAFLAGWLHLITLTFTLLPFVFYGIAALRDGLKASWLDALRCIVPLIVLGLVTILPLLLALLPPMLNDWASLAGKAGDNAVTLVSLYRSALMLFGVAGAWPFVAMSVLLLFGIASLWRHDPGLAAYFGMFIVVSAAVVALARPAWVQHPGVYCRYLQPALPLLLFFMAQGFVALCQRLHAALQALFAFVLPTALLLIGPIPGYSYNPNQFMGHPFFQFDYNPDHNLYFTDLPAVAIPRFYRDLARAPARSLTLVESPWSLRSDHDPQPMYQRVHRQYVKIGILTPLCGPPAYGEFPAHSGMRLREFVNISQILGGHPHGGDLLIVHKTRWPPNMGPAWHWPNVPACLALIRQKLGPPAYDSRDLDVFALSEKGRATLYALGLMR